MAWSKRLLIVVALVASTIPLTAQGPTGQITGVLADPAGAVLPGVAVTINTRPQTTTVSNIRGRFSFIGVPNGTFELKAALSGFEMPTWTVTIKNGEAIDLGVTVANLGAVEPNLAVMGLRPGEIAVGFTTSAGNFSVVVTPADSTGARRFLEQIDAHAFDGGEIQPLVADNGSLFKGVSGLVLIGHPPLNGLTPTRVYLVHGALTDDAAGHHVLGRQWHWAESRGDGAARIAQAPFVGEAFVTPVTITTVRRMVFLGP